MRAFVITGPGRAEVQDVDLPKPGTSEVVVAIERAGVCGTDSEFFSGEMAYLKSGDAQYPIRIGHEWSGVIESIGDGVDPSWLGRRVTGDTMLGCGSCSRCHDGRWHLCDNRFEIGVRRGWPGALAKRLAVPASALHALPDTVDATLGAMVEPGGNALRAVWAAELAPGDRVLVLGPGTIGLLIGLIAAARGAEVHLLGRSERSRHFARSLGFEQAWTTASLPTLPWDAVIDASNGGNLPAFALDLVEPGRRLVFIGLAGRPSLIDTRSLALKDVTAVGVLGASQGLAGTIDLYASGAVDPRPLVLATVGLDDVASVLRGERRKEWGGAPKIHVDPRL